MARVLVIGGVAAGMSAAAQARKHDPLAEVIVLERGKDVSYGACGLPYYFSGLIDDWRALVRYTAERFSRERGVTVLLEHDVVELDTRAGVVVARTASGDRVRFGYDSLVIATGARAVVPEIPGTDEERVFTVRTLEDGRRLRGFLDEERPRSCVVVGGGLLGLELAVSFAERDISVTVVELARQLVPDLEEQMAELVADRLLANGVALHLGDTAAGIAPVDGRLGVQLREGSVTADFAVLAIGVRPNSELAAAAGIELGAKGAIAVDETAATSAAGVWAAGDCAEVAYVPTGERLYLPAGNTSNKQGRVAGKNAAGGRERFEGVVGTRVSKVFDLEVARTGFTSAQAKERGLEPVVSTIEAYSRSSYYPGGSRLTICVIAQQGTGRLLGAQMIGEEGCAKRIDTFATALHAGMDLRQVGGLDLSYAPPFAPAIDPILVACHEAAKRVAEPAGAGA